MARRLAVADFIAFAPDALTFSVWDSHRHNPIGPLITEILAGFFPHDPPQFYHVPFSYHRIDPIKDSLGEAGFADLRIAVLSLNNTDLRKFLDTSVSYLRPR